MDDDCIYIDECDADRDKFDDCEGWIECNGCGGWQCSICIKKHYGFQLTDITT